MKPKQGLNPKTNKNHDLSTPATRPAISNHHATRNTPRPNHHSKLGTRTPLGLNRRHPTMRLVVIRSRRRKRSRSGCHTVKPNRFHCWQQPEETNGTWPETMTAWGKGRCRRSGNHTPPSIHHPNSRRPTPARIQMSCRSPDVGSQETATLVLTNSISKRCTYHHFLVGTSISNGNR